MNFRWVADKGDVGSSFLNIFFLSFHINPFLLAKVDRLF